MWRTLPHCCAALCGSATPAAFHAIMVRPEQSNVFGPAVPKTYFLPSCAYAYATALPAWPETLGGGIGFGGLGVALGGLFGGAGVFGVAVPLAFALAAAARAAASAAALARAMSSSTLRCIASSRAMSPSILARLVARSIFCAFWV